MNDHGFRPAYRSGMPKPPSFPFRPKRRKSWKAPKPPAIRIHFIAEWAFHREVIAAQIAEAMSTNKSTVSKWFSGALPSEKNLLEIARLLDVQPNDLFHDPKDGWLNDFFEGRDEIEQDRIKSTLAIAFPAKGG